MECDLGFVWPTRNHQNLAIGRPASRQKLPCLGAVVAIHGGDSGRKIGRIKRVWKIDAEGKSTVLAAAEAFPQPPSYLNDMAAAPDGKSVFVTDMGDNTKMRGPDGLWPVDSEEAKKIGLIGRVYRIDLEGKVELAVDVAAAMLNPNGVTAPEPGLLLIAEFFHGNILSHRDGKLETLQTGLRGADGIERGPMGEIYISSWSQGKVWRIAKPGDPPEVIIEGHKSAADFFLDAKKGV